MYELIDLPISYNRVLRVNVIPYVLYTYNGIGTKIRMNPPEIVFQTLRYRNRSNDYNTYYIAIMVWNIEN